MTRRLSRSKTAGLALVAASVLAAGTACGTLTGVPASLATAQDSGAVYAINGAPAGAPTALYIFGGTLLAADATFTFDVAFDLDNAGNVIVLPQRAVASSLASTHTVSLQTSSTSFDQLGSAPKNGYRADTALVTTTKQTILVQSQDATACSTSLTGTTLYAKIVVDSVNLATKELFVRFATDPNCGFFSFASGIPKD